MHYTTTSGQHSRTLRAFVDIGRTTMSSERLTVKLIDHARLFTYETQPAARRKPHTTGP
ncbi:hypothetical protein [Streptomyces sp. NPDC126514]|uniref:hypothetical protein n=1 Tax=Streptomyces sp. NPDC126514 TaxID=3155210 RepID=UPI003318DA79